MAKLVVFCYVSQALALPCISFSVLEEMTNQGYSVTIVTMTFLGEFKADKPSLCAWERDDVGASSADFKGSDKD